ncbi:hypothetical protein F5J12DRAFT_807143, partial [Pisolithus orientalis]|uniref:uncharacterized protein n=1 Tax=Pisolithus orientalis TaxID=936130 RepID=UPI0022249335
VCGPWGPSIARRPCPPRVPAVCMGFGSCTVSIFSCPAMATLAGQASIFLLLSSPNPNPSSHGYIRSSTSGGSSTGVDVQSVNTSIELQEDVRFETFSFGFG